ncbi:diphthamide biosynthesis protein 2 [Umbelopsis sp. PMI_123]|nr:diphthamide biosynthesis protein 2 [Umbelopsis sp. PMI_123]
MSSLNGPAAFADDGRTTIERTMEVNVVKIEDIDGYYEIERTCQRILEGGYSRIALQFPDELLADSAAVASKLRERTEKSVFILADTSYGSCCVDEVAAEHVNADFIVHYGRSCLSPTSRLPVLYVFGQQSISVERCVSEFDRLIENKDTPIIVMYDVIFSHASDQINEQLRKIFFNTIATKITNEANINHISQEKSVSNIESIEERSDASDNCCSSNTCCKKPDTNKTILTPDQAQGGRTYVLPEGVKLEDCTILYIGQENITLTNIMMVHNKCPVITYSPEKEEAHRESVPVNRLLMKRYFLVQKAKDADVIGIVVGTLGVASYMNIIDHLKKLIAAAGKKSYTFVMGKLNVAKMANFMEIDCYVLVACPENSLIDSKEFYRPIVTPFELEMALSKQKEWTGDYITDFQQLLPGLRDDEFTYDDEEEREENSSDEEPHFSLITGEYKRERIYGSKNLDGTSLLTSGITDLSLRNNETALSSLLESPSGAFLKSRTFRGLEQNTGEHEASLVEEGRSGIARGYSTEKDLNSSTT